MPKIWIKAECWVTKAMLEVAQSAFLYCDALGIEIDDGVLPEGKHKYEEDKILVTAYFDPDNSSPLAITETVSRFFVECGMHLPAISFVDFPEEDWQANFVKTCTTFMVEPDIYIVPSFEIDAFLKKPLKKLYIEMDPENAFGTGQHQTTKLCLSALRRCFKDKNDYVCLDVGTGSGILAILMKKLGAKSVLATETDADALGTAERNARKNGVQIDTLYVKENHHYQKEKFDIVVANILAPVLITMATELSSCLKKKGAKLILSGILLPQAESVIDAYQAQNLTLIEKDTMDDWCALVFINE